VLETTSWRHPAFTHGFRDDDGWACILGDVEIDLVSQQPGFLLALGSARDGLSYEAVDERPECPGCLPTVRRR